ncbi:hypothetical protein MIZ01_0080 [Sideroxyarcus emersonii]|uniref:Uncharacterized protein n=1 Tax=Sideroxyarcus emersonii TaxID=2764705 RepID=A0AAN1X7Q2_9PROT|nr:hypothetical protein [Sideroxyarcus emersonii]BCK86326.1 hypothetical protein MIZ01_0080 [Sideroxyarcus emersonii]
MNGEEQLQQNIRRTTGRLALKKIRAIVDAEDASAATAARVRRGLLRYGWIVLLAVAALLAHLTGVY